MPGERHGRPALRAALPLLIGLSAEARGFYQPPLPLPETLRGTVQVPVSPGGEAPADTLQQLYPRLAACWRAPEGLARFERTEITVRFSLRRDGSVIGPPRITFAQAPADARGRALLEEAALSAIRRCIPARVTPGLGGAIAGRQIALRFVYEGPRGRDL